MLMINKAAAAGAAAAAAAAAGVAGRRLEGALGRGDRHLGYRACRPRLRRGGPDAPADVPAHAPAAPGPGARRHVQPRGGRPRPGRRFRAARAVARTPLVPSGRLGVGHSGHGGGPCAGAGPPLPQRRPAGADAGPGAAAEPGARSAAADGLRRRGRPLPRGLDRGRLEGAVRRQAGGVPRVRDLLWELRGNHLSNATCLAPLV